MKLLPIAAIAASAVAGSAVAVVVVDATGAFNSAPTIVNRTVTAVSGSPASSTDQSSVGQIYRDNVAGVVEIKTDTSGSSSTPDNPFGTPAEQAQGTGFMIDTRGDIVTNDHVVSGASSITVTTDAGNTYAAKVVGADPTTDVAVVRISAPQSALHPLTLADSSGVQVGDGVVAIGDPFGLTDTVTSGIVSALDRTITSPNNHPITGVIQTDAAINHGNSGGPLFNSSGQVIGITSQIYADSQNSGNVGVGFVVPSNTVHGVVTQLIAKGSVSHPFIGIYLADVTGSVAQATGMPVGVEVTQVKSGSPGAKAGLHGATGQKVADGGQFPTGGDVITAVDGRKVTTADQVVQIVSAKRPGESLTLTIVRGGSTQNITVTLGSES